MMLVGSRALRRMLSAAVITIGMSAGLMSAQAQSPASPPDAFKNALAAYDKAWSDAGLFLMTAVFSAGPSSGFGDYTPRADAVFADDEAINVYAEPVGYGFRETDGGFAYELTADYRLLTNSGQVLAEQENFATFSGTGRSKQRELSAALTFQFSGLPAGDYQLETSFTDEIDGATSAFTLPFSVSASN
jgi:Flp pilus assembly protein TadG